MPPRSRSKTTSLKRSSSPCSPSPPAKRSRRQQSVSVSSKRPSVSKKAASKKIMSKKATSKKEKEKGKTRMISKNDVDVIIHCRRHMIRHAGRLMTVVQIKPRQSIRGGIVSEQAFYQTSGQNSRLELGTNSGGTWLPFNGISDILHVHKIVPVSSHGWFNKASFMAESCTSGMTRFATVELMQISERMGGGLWNHEEGIVLRKQFGLVHTPIDQIQAPTNSELNVVEAPSSAEVNQYIGSANYYGVKLEQWRLQSKANKNKTYLDYKFIVSGGDRKKASIVVAAWDHLCYGYLNDDYDVVEVKDIPDYKAYNDAFSNLAEEACWQST